MSFFVNLWTCYLRCSVWSSIYTSQPFYQSQLSFTLSLSRRVHLSTIYKWRPPASPLHNKTIVWAEPERTSIVPTWQHQRQPVTFYCGNLQWVLASPVWSLTDCRLLQNRCSNNDLVTYAHFYSKTVSRRGCVCPNLMIHLDLYCENAVLSPTGWLFGRFNVTCHICLGKAKIEHFPGRN